jgi:hypothetical protein
MSRTVLKRSLPLGHGPRAYTLRSASRGSTMDYLKPYDRATVGLWLRNHTQLTNETGNNVMVGAATHAVLAGLRRHPTPTALLASYGSDAAADLAMIESLVLEALSEACWRVRDSAFYLRWLELADDAV